MKYGFTTGSAATAANKAALLFLITQVEKEIVVTTPAGRDYMPSIYGYEIHRKASDGISVGDYASCYVLKESGDDPDITAGIEIHSKVTIIDLNTNMYSVKITGGTGIGIVTRPGLDQTVGEYAINSVPRKMIEEAVRDVLNQYGLSAGINVEISVPQGVEIAKKTFNPHMGIEGGISIIGTSGIVKPMSTEALLDTIKLDINMQYEEGKETCVIVPGNYGVTFLENNYSMNEKEIVLCSNYVGDSMKFAVETGFKKILFCSHIGKMIKVSGGVMNTHSMYGDRRMEFMWDAIEEVIKNNSCSSQGTKVDFENEVNESMVNENEANEKIVNDEDINVIRDKIMSCVSTTAALNVLEEYGLIKSVSDVIVKKTKKQLEAVCDNRTSVDVILYENSYGELAKI